jgi:hypothetical protein
VSASWTIAPPKPPVGTPPPKTTTAQPSASVVPAGNVEDVERAVAVRVAVDRVRVVMDLVHDDAEFALVGDAVHVPVGLRPVDQLAHIAGAVAVTVGLVGVRIVGAVVHRVGNAVVVGVGRAHEVGRADSVVAAGGVEEGDDPLVVRLAAVRVAGNEGAVGADVHEAERCAVRVFGRRGGIRLEEEADRVHDARPRCDVEDAVVVRVEVLEERAREARHEQVRDVVGVLEVEVGREVRGAEREGRLGRDEEAARRDRLPGEARDLLDRARARIADHEIRQAVQARARGAGQLEVLVNVRSGLVDPYLADLGRTACLRDGRRREGDDRADTAQDLHLSLLCLFFLGAGPSGASGPDSL